MRLLLRCDASPAVGVGHLVRSLAIAEQARARGHDVLLVGSIGPSWVRNQVTELGVPLQPPPGWDDLADLAAHWLADVVHVDHYDAPAGLRAAVGRAGVVLSNVEDGTWGRRPADVVVDPTWGAERADRPDDGSGQLLRGGRFVLVRGSVRRARVRRSGGGRSTTTPHVVVVMGGTDARGVLARAVRAVVDAGRPAQVVAIGPEGTTTAGLGVTSSGIVAVTAVGPRPDLPEVMADADLVITASGTTAWELCCIGVPMAVLPVVDNQRAVHDALVSAGAAEGLQGPDRLEDLAPPRLARLLKDRSARDRLAQAALELVDGCGTARLLAVLEAEASARRPRAGLGPTPVAVRVAVPADASVLLEWRNDELTRHWSRQGHLVGRPEHQAWLAATLSRPDRHLLVAEDAAAAPVGTVRWDAVPEEPGAWEVSITMSPDQRGRGLAGSVLAAAERWLAAHEPDASRLLAGILTGNAASERLFERAGYLPDQPPDDAGFAGYRKKLAGG